MNDKRIKICNINLNFAELKIFKSEKIPNKKVSAMNKPKYSCFPINNIE